MGMFDWLTCDAPLAVPAHQGLDFQTQSLENGLHRYRITADGELWLARYDDLTEVFSEPERVPFDGEVRFYDVLDVAGAPDEWVEYTAQFSGGKMQSLELHKAPYKPYNWKRDTAAREGA